MADEMKGRVEQMLAQSTPEAVTDAVKDTIGHLPPAEVAAQAQSAVVKLHDQGQTDIAKELEDILRGIVQNPVAVQGAVIGFIERHPETLPAFSPTMTKSIVDKT